MSEPTTPSPLSLSVAMGLAILAGGCVEPPEKFDVAASDDEAFRATEVSENCGIEDAGACKALELTELVCGDIREGPCAVLDEQQCELDSFMVDCNHDNHNTERIVPGKVVAAKFDDRYGNEYTIDVLVGANYGIDDAGHNIHGHGDYGCMGKCGDGCEPILVTALANIEGAGLIVGIADALGWFDWAISELDDHLTELGIGQAADVWSLDCLEHDICSYLLWEGGPGQHLDLDCGDEWVDVYDDFLQTDVTEWGSGGPFCAGHHGDGAVKDAAHRFGRPGDRICGPDGTIWECDADSLDDPWIRNGEACDVDVTVDEIDEWGDGLCVDLTISNPNDVAVTWAVTLDTPDGEYLEFWNAELVADHGTALDFVGQGWNQTLAPGQSTSMGFCREGLSGGVCVLGPDGCAGLTVNLLPPSSQWDTGLCRGVEVINFTTDWVDWQVTLELDGQLDGHWSANAACQGTTCTFSGKDWNNLLEPDDPDDNVPGGGSASFEYCVEDIDQGGGADLVEETVIVHGYKPGSCQDAACLNWWEDSGIDVEAGHTIGLDCPPDAGEISWTAGAPRTCAGQDGTWDASIAPQCPVFSLVAKVGADGVPQCIGMSGEFVAAAPGRLYLGFNDGDVFSDNLGSWSVDVTVD